MAILIIGSERSADFAAAARAFDPKSDVRIWPDTGNPADIRYALAWRPPAGALATVPNLELIVSVGAGVDHLLKDPELPAVPLVRFVDPDLTERMVEYVGSQVLFHQRRMTDLALQQRDKIWRYVPEPAARDVRVGVMGLGVMGTASLAALKGFGYQLSGWSRTPKSLPGVRCFAGKAQFDTFLASTDILVCLLPLTADTQGILNRDLIRKLSRSGRSERLPGPVLINAGRGGQQVGADILAALDAGELYAASLDVFDTEPLPETSPFWTHPRVVVTPHSAAETLPEAITRYLFRQIGCHREGRPLENVVDRARGY